MQKGEGGFAHPSPARRAAAQDCTFGAPALAGQSSQGGSSAVSRHVCGHRPAPGPLTACFQLQPERGPVAPYPVPPYCTMPAPRPPCLTGALRLSPVEPAQLARHLPSAAPLITSRSPSSVLYHRASTFKHPCAGGAALPQLLVLQPRAPGMPGAWGQAGPFQQWAM